MNEMKVSVVMAEPDPVDLIHREDADGTRCIVRVTGRSQPGVLTGHDILYADVLVSASHVDAKLDVYFFQKDLGDWQRDLSGIAPGRQATIGGDRGLSLTLHMNEDGQLRVAVEDLDRLSTLVGIRPEENWIDEHQQRLGQVRQTWPSEVVETAPMAYEGSPNRRR